MISWIRSGRSLIIGLNDTKCAPFYRRQYDNQEPLFSKHNLGAIDYSPHAEARVIHMALRQGVCLRNKDIYVLRMKKSGGLGTSHPCAHCMQLIREQGLRRIYYIGEDLMWHQKRV